jgi:enamine deaminase RidA (YjgF/YER057c/UK114 family)
VTSALPSRFALGALHIPSFIERLYPVAVAKIAQRLAELGIELPPVVAPIAAYVPAICSGNLLFTAGQLPFVAGRMLATGTVGQDVDEALAVECARVCALNALAAAHSVLGLDRIERPVKVTAYIAATRGFAQHARVADGASELLGAVFGDVAGHARTSLGALSLPLIAPVEIDFVFAVR